METRPAGSAYSLQATFDDADAARRAAGEVRGAGLDVTVSVGTASDERAALDAEMRDEMESAVVGPGNVGPFTKSMTKGVALFVPIATVVGAVVGLLFGFVPWPDVGLPLRFAIWGISGAVAGATAGFVIGGFTKPRLDREGERLDSETGVVVGVHAGSPEPLDRARTILERHGAGRVSSVGPGGPRGPSSEDEARPLGG
jgi:hypothetical protein